LYCENHDLKHNVWKGCEEFMCLVRLVNGCWGYVHCMSEYYSGWWDGYSVNSTLCCSLDQLELYGTGQPLQAMYAAVLGCAVDLKFPKGLQLKERKPSNTGGRARDELPTSDAIKGARIVWQGLVKSQANNKLQIRLSH